MTIFEQRLAQRLDERRATGLYRQRLSVSSPAGSTTKIGKHSLINFCSNDYLGLAGHPVVAQALVDGVQHYGAGSGASHLVCGHSEAHEALEKALAAHTGRARALLFSSGYQANVSTLAALLQRGDIVIQDRLNHASLLDGGRLSGAKRMRFRHNDMDDLASRLAAAPDNVGKLVVVDGVFSMDGDQAPLADIAALTAQHNAWLMVDDAHGIGVLGDNGAGSVAAAGLSTEDVPVLMATLGKSLGVAGAVVAGSDTLIESLIQFARGYVYSTAMPPALAMAATAALHIVRTEPRRREHVGALIEQFRRGAQDLGLALMPSQTPIQPVLAGDAQRALAWSADLRRAGILVQAIRPPTVPAGSARLRITLTAAHSAAQVDQLLEALADVCRDR